MTVLRVCAFPPEIAFESSATGSVIARVRSGGLRLYLLARAGGAGRQQTRSAAPSTHYPLDGASARLSRLARLGGTDECGPPRNEICPVTGSSGSAGRADKNAFPLASAGPWTDRMGPNVSDHDPVPGQCPRRIRPEAGVGVLRIQFSEAEVSPAVSLSAASGDSPASPISPARRRRRCFSPHSRFDTVGASRLHLESCLRPSVVISSIASLSLSHNRGQFALTSPPSPLG